MASSDPSALWRFAMRQLERPGGRFRWRKGGLQAVARVLDRKLADPSGGADAIEAIEAVGGLLRLGSALRRQLGAPEAADALQAILRSRPGAIRIARDAFGSGRARAVRRRFAASLGERPGASAPRLGESVAPGAVRMIRFIDPTDMERRRAQTRTGSVRADSTSATRTPERTGAASAALPRTNTPARRRRTRLDHGESR